MNQQQFRNIVYLSDKSGTGMWRRIWPIPQLNCISQNLNFQVDYSQTPILDQNFYKGVNSITVQRWINDAQVNLFTKFFKPICDANTGWLVYEIDDNMCDAEIPKFNRGRKAFEGEHIQENIRQMLQAADFVTVTTDYLKQFYHEHYGVPLENILAIPNFLPKYLFGDRYDVDKKIKQFGKLKSKPRIGIVSSLSHFNIDNVREDKNGLAVREEKQKDGTSKWINEKNEEVKFEDTTKITDDFDDIAECIRSTVNDFQWVCFGYAPPQIKDLVESKKVEFHGGVPINNYASVLEQLQLQAIVAPIKKMVFNYSKSFIKYMEGASVGVPVYATNCLPYNRIMPEDQLFDTADELKQKLLKLKFTSTNIYKDKIERQWNWLNSPCKEGDFQIKNYWLEDNLNIYIDLFRLRNKTLSISFDSFSKQYEKRLEEQKNNTIFKNENVLITK